MGCGSLLRTRYGLLLYVCVYGGGVHLLAASCTATYTRCNPRTRRGALQEVVDCATAHWGDPRAAVDELVRLSNARWMEEEQVIDDTTIIVVFLEPEARGGPRVEDAATAELGLEATRAYS